MRTYCLALISLIMMPIMGYAQADRETIFFTLQAAQRSNVQVNGEIFSAAFQQQNSISNRQAGENNRIQASTVGRSNVVAFSQIGNENEINLSLVGDNNQYTFTQTGGTNKIDVSNPGATSNTQLTIIQQGEGNTLVATDNMTTNGIKIIQSGGAKAIINGSFYSFPNAN